MKKIILALLLCLSFVGAKAADSTTNQASAASLIVRAAPRKLVSIRVHSFKISPQYILVMDSTTLPANGAVTLLCPPIKVLADDYREIKFEVPVAASAGIVVCNSSTAPSKTIGAADCIFTVQTQ